MMSTATAANAVKEEEKKVENVVDAEMNKNPVLNDRKSKEISKEDVSDNGDLDAMVSELDSTLKTESDLSSEPQFSLKEQLRMDKDEANLRTSEVQVLGSVDVSIVESKGPEVKVLNLIVQSPGRPDNVVPTPFHPSTSKSTLFTLKEGCKQQIKFEFVVSRNAVSGLKYIGEVWKKGIKVDTTKKTVGKFSPREEPYKFELEEATTPSGFFARGSFAARTRFVDEGGKCHFDATYYFDIQKNWAC